MKAIKFPVELHIFSQDIKTMGGTYSTHGETINTHTSISFKKKKLREHSAHLNVEKRIIMFVAHKAGSKYVNRRFEISAAVIMIRSFLGFDATQNRQ